MIDTTKYKSGKRRPLMFNIRLSRKGVQPTADEVIEVLEYILANGRVKPGWKFAAIDWRNASMADGTWITGKISLFDERALGKVITAALSNARISIVRKSGSTSTVVEDFDDDEDFDNDD